MSILVFALLLAVLIFILEIYTEDSRQKRIEEYQKELQYLENQYLQEIYNQKQQ